MISPTTMHFVNILFFTFFPQPFDLTGATIKIMTGVLIMIIIIIIVTVVVTTMIILTINFNNSVTETKIRITHDINFCAANE